MAAALEGARQLTKDWDEDIPVSFESAIIHLGGAAGNLKTVIDRMTNERNE
jgi:hypothetical protein